MKLIENLFSGFLPFTLLLICGLYLTFKLKFVQFLRFGKSLRLIKSALKCKSDNTNGITSAQSACTALSATVGTGNIAGVAGALSLGGAGAVFWMWISAVLGMAVKYAEITLAVKYRQEKENSFLGGPMLYIEKGLSNRFKPLGFLFAAAAIPAVFCTGNITQTNAAISSVNIADNKKILVGILFAVLTFIIIKGGGKSIGKATEKIVPIMSVIYILMTFGVIFYNIDFLPTAFKMIFVGAFTPKAVTSGTVCSLLSVIITGASRGIFSNEAGLGTSAMAHSSAFDANAETQGLYGIFEVFIDTIVICTLTALTILCSRVNIDYGNIASSELVADALHLNYGKFSSVLLGGMMCIFGFSSIIGWALYGHICLEFVFGKKALKFFNLLYPLGCIAGAIWETELAWRLSSLFNGIMLCINLPVILLLNDKIKSSEGRFKDERKNRKN